MRLLAVFLCCMCLAAPATAASNRLEAETSFRAWIGKLWPEAKRAGVPRPVFENAFMGVTLDWSLPDLAPPGRPAAGDNNARRQSEFAAPGCYFRQRQIAALVAGARAKQKKWAKTLRKIEKRYGVPGPVLLAIWGRETSYGRVKIPYDALRSLATLAFMGRRKAYFRPEVIAALKILAQGHIRRSELKSSWAGAMGQNQMLPSAFLKYAVDFDGDGRRNIWTSVPDTLATTANFLKQNGWRKNLAWGYEVTLPKGFDCTLEGPHRMRPIARWTALGVARTGGRKFPAYRLKTRGSILLPAGVFGPAFVVTPNFYVLKKYNESDLYALMVGHVADRLAVNRPFYGKWQKVSTYTRAKIKRLQKRLIADGYNIGDTLDGLIGFRTRTAIGLFQKSHHRKPTCWPDRAVFDLLK